MRRAKHHYPPDDCCLLAHASPVCPWPPPHPPAHARGPQIVTADGTKVGEVTSGAFSPCLKKNIAMG